MTTPWEHQKTALEFLKRFYRRGVLYWGGMGVGKTKTAIDLIFECGHKTVLVAAPLAAVPVWGEEVEKHATESAVVAMLKKGSVSERTAYAKRAMESARTADVPCIIVVNYEAAWRPPFKKWALGQFWDLVITDEIHRIKSPSSKVSWFFKALGFRARTRLGLSGTPLANSPLDIYAQFRFLDPKVYGTSFALFRSRYALMGGYNNRQVVGYQNLEELQKKMFSITHYVDRSAIKLPPAHSSSIPIDLPPKAMNEYKALKRDFVSAVGNGTVTAANALTRLIRLQQIANGFVKYDDGRVEQLHTAKRDALADLLKDVAEPVVIFCMFHEDLNAIQDACRSDDRDTYELSGRVNQVDEWKASGDSRKAIAVQMRAGSEAISLVDAPIAIYYSAGFSLALYEQSKARNHRPGQKADNVYHIHLTSVGTVDKDIYAALKAKRNIVDYIIESSKGEVE